MTEESENQEGEITQPPEVRDDSEGLFARVFERTTQQGPGAMGGGPLIPRRYVEFDVDGAECSPGMFVDDQGRPVTFRLTLQSLLSGEEISATAGVTDPAAAVQHMARASLHQVNGAVIPSGPQREFLWEALGPGGRQLVLAMFQEIGSVTPVGLGKAMASYSKR